MASASPSASPDRRKKEKKKHKKEEKPKKKTEKEDREGRRRKRSPSRESPPRRRARHEVEPEVHAPNFSASGLLDGPSGLLDGPPPRGVADRSRSRDAPQRPSLGPAAHPLDPFSDRGGMDSQDKGKGKGKSSGKGKETEDPAEPKEEPNFEASGLLAVEDNSKNGIPLKFTVPIDVRRPDRKWRLYIFSKQLKDGKMVHIHRLNGYLFGKDRRVADVPTDHPTCSKQHAVLHYRMHSASGTVQPYIMDLESTNGTHVNGERIEPARYYQLKEKDVLKFGLSSREHVLLAADSANDMHIDPKLLHHDSD
mmetsp:Transcript_23047/g.44283  ORF Transcript_23047/g.44283 Transcript_23047/m.44283 type:complete len:309 (-) Transcript_23047:33-959(-)